MTNERERHCSNVKVAGTQARRRKILSRLGRSGHLSLLCLHRRGQVRCREVAEIASLLPASAATAAGSACLTLRGCDDEDESMMVMMVMLMLWERGRWWWPAPCTAPLTCPINTGRLLHHRRFRFTSFGWLACFPWGSSFGRLFLCCWIIISALQSAM